jgi:hypothetical protein
MNKKITILILSLLWSYLIIAQEKKYSSLKQYYFDSYQPAEVITKSNKKIKLKLNYNVLLDEMHFYVNGEKVRYEKVNDVLYIKFEDENFVPLNNEYYILVYAGKSIVYLKLAPNLSPLNRPSSGAYGTPTETSSVSKMSVIEERNFIRQRLIEVEQLVEIDISVYKRFFLLKEDKLLPLTKNTLYKAFEGKKATIKAFIKKNKISLRKSGDIEKLFTYCDSL